MDAAIDSIANIKGLYPQSTYLSKAKLIRYTDFLEFIVPTISKPSTEVTLDDKRGIINEFIDVSLNHAGIFHKHDSKRLIAHGTQQKSPRCGRSSPKIQDSS